MGHINMSQIVNTNDLQQAIDEVANNSVAPEVDTIKDQMGVPPVPPAYDEVAPVAPVAEPAPEVAPIPEPVVAAAPAPVEAAPVVPDDANAVKAEALKELVPIIDKVNLPAEQKFAMVTDFITSTGDKSIAGSALAIARGMTDENMKAESLLKLVQML